MPKSSTYLQDPNQAENFTYDSRIIKGIPGRTDAIDFSTWENFEKFAAY